MAQMIKVEDILIPKGNVYVRGKVNKDNLERMSAAITGKDWPFPPIKLRRLEEPVKRKGREYHLVVIDGVHRTITALNHKRTEIPSVIEKMSEVEAEVEQLRTNLSHGLLVDKKHRDRWVRFLVKERKVKVSDLSKELHMTERSIFRMVKGGQTKEGPRKKSKRKSKASAESKDTQTKVEWTPADYFKRLQAMAKETKAPNGEALAEYIKQNKDKLAPWLDPFMDLLAGN
jgi:ParB-like chromosome segregation protein Spo0J